MEMSGHSAPIFRKSSDPAVGQTLGQNVSKTDTYVDSPSPLWNKISKMSKTQTNQSNLQARSTEMSTQTSTDAFNDKRENRYIRPLGEFERLFNNIFYRKFFFRARKPQPSLKQNVQYVKNANQSVTSPSSRDLFLSQPMRNFDFFETFLLFFGRTSFDSLFFRWKLQICFGIENRK